MKKIILTICFCLITSLSFSAELLVQMEDSKFEKGAKKGDIIIAKPDGWKWGKSEQPPQYVVFKLPEMPVEEAKKYEEQVIEITGTDRDTKYIVVKNRKYSIDSLEVDDAKLKFKGVKTIDKTKVIKFKDKKIKDKTK